MYVFSSLCSAGNRRKPQIFAEHRRIFSQKTAGNRSRHHREGLNGVGTDGVGVKLAPFPSKLQSLRGCSCPRRKTKKTKQETKKIEEKQRTTTKRRKTKKKKGKIPPTPSTPTPLRTSQHQRTAKGASGKWPGQNSSKIVKKCHDKFRHFSTRFA